MSESPAHPLRPALRALLSLALLLTVPLLLPIALPIGCLEEKSVEPCIEYQLGVLEGYVLAGGEPMRADVAARPGPPAQYWEAWERIADCTTDSLGWYRLELPVGTYVLDVDGDFTGDTVQVYPITQRRDLRLGRLAARLTHAGAIEGYAVDIRLSEAWPGYSYFQSYYTASGIVHDGSLDIVFPVIKPGRYLVGIGGDAGQWWLPGTRDAREATVVTIPGDRTAGFQASLDRIAVLSGRMEPCPGVAPWRPTLEAIDADSTVVGSAGTRADGSFRLALLEARPVRLRVDEDRDQWIGGGTYEEATVFAPEPGERIDDITLEAGGIRVELEGPGVYSGHRGIITLIDERGHSFSGWIRNGSGGPCGLRAGRYRVHISGSCDSEPWIPQWFDGAATQEEATWVDIAAGETTTITARLRGGGSIRGRLVDCGDLPNTPHIRIHDATGPLCRSGRSYSHNVFAFNGLENGRYYLEVRLYDGHPLGESWWYPGTAVFDSARAVAIVDHEVVTGIEWSFRGE